MYEIKWIFIFIVLGLKPIFICTADLVDEEILGKYKLKDTCFTQKIYWASIFEEHVIITNGPIETKNVDEELHFELDPILNDTFALLKYKTYLFLKVISTKRVYGTPVIRIFAIDTYKELVGITFVVFENYEEYVSGEYFQLENFVVLLVFLMLVVMLYFKFYSTPRKLHTNQKYV